MSGTNYLSLTGCEILSQVHAGNRLGTVGIPAKPQSGRVVSLCRKKTMIKLPKHKCVH